MTPATCPSPWRSAGPGSTASRSSPTKPADDAAARTGARRCRTATGQRARVTGPCPPAGARRRAARPRGFRRLSRRAAAALALAALPPCAAHAVAEAAAGDAPAADRSLRIGLWGVPVPDDDGEGRPTGPRAGASVAIERSRWSDSGPNRARIEQPPADGGGQGRTAVDVTDVSYRWGVSNARESLDVGVGASAYRLRSGVHPLGSAATVVRDPDGRRDIVVPTFSVGMRRSLSQEHRVDLYASGTASMALPEVGGFYTAKVKVEWLPGKNSGLGLEQSSVNMRFGPNSSLALRVRNRGPVLYYRARF